ncbi:hypothetical protein LTS17_001903 [Exophiala oligosperma]
MAASNCAQGDLAQSPASEKQDAVEEATSTALEERNKPPNGGYGWVCTVAAAVVNAHSWGFSSAYAVFLAYYLDHQVFKGATRLEYAFVGSLSLTMTFLVSPIATIATQRYGIRKTMFIGVIFETASLFCASLATQIWHLFLTQGLLFGMGLGMMFIPTTAVVPQWFTTKRSLASGISVSGAGLGGLMYSLVAEALIRQLGLVWAFRILGVLAFAVNVSCVLLIRDRREPTKVSFRKAALEVPLFKRADFNLLIGFSCFTIFGYFILIFSLAAYGVHIGLTSSQASLIAGLFNLGQAVGRPLIGYFSDTIGRIKMAGVATFLAGAITLAVWNAATNYGVLIFFALSEGTVAGNFWATIAPLVAEVLGLEKMPAGMNAVWLSIIIPATFSEPIAQIMVARTGSYLGAQLFAGFMYVAASACLAVLFWRQRRR